MELTFGNIISAVSLIIAIFLFLRGQYISRETALIKDDITKLKENQVSKTEFAAMQKQVELFWSIVQKSMAEMLHSPHTPEMDALLEKLTNDTIDHDEIVTLLCRVNDEIADLNKKRFISVLQPTDKPRILGLTLLKAGLTARLASVEKELAL